MSHRQAVTVQAVRAELARRLGEVGIASCEVDAALLVQHVTGWSAAELRARAGQRLADDVLARLQELAARRAAREPLQLLLGSVGFRRLELEVRAGVFIPRPETEVLAGHAIDRVPPGGVVVEPCTGAGAVACAIAHESAAATVVATDASPGAVELATVNAARHGLAVTVVEGDLLSPVDPGLRGRVDVLVSNPPYLAERELDEAEPEVVAWDPYLALVAGPTGHEISDRLVRDAGSWLAPGGWLLCEVDERRARMVARRARTAGLVDTAVVADLAGRDRIVLARRPPA